MFHWAFKQEPRLRGWRGMEWFCKIDPDALFVADNFRQLLNSRRVDSSEPWFLAKLQYFWKMEVGVFPDAGPGICISRGGLWRLGRYLGVLIASRRGAKRRNATNQPQLQVAL